MGSDYVVDALCNIEVPGAAEARKRAMAAARVAYRPPSATSAGRTRRFVIALASIALLVALSFTPPGEAATGWVGRLVGIGESPTLEQVGSVKGSATVLASGALSDGTPYEVVAKKVDAESTGFRGMPNGVCFQVDWPSTEAKGQGGACTEMSFTGEANRPGLETSGLFRPPGGANSGPAIFMGIAENPRIATVRVGQINRDGDESKLPSQLLNVSGDTLQRVGGRYPVSAFFAVLDAEVVAGGNDRQAQVTAIAYDADGNEIDRTDAFPPLDCPPNSRELLPRRPSSGPEPHPATPQEIQRAVRCAP